MTPHFPNFVPFFSPAPGPFSHCRLMPPVYLIPGLPQLLSPAGRVPGGAIPPQSRNSRLFPPITPSTPHSHSRPATATSLFAQSLSRRSSRLPTPVPTCAHLGGGVIPHTPSSSPFPTTSLSIAANRLFIHGPSYPSSPREMLPAVISCHCLSCCLEPRHPFSISLIRNHLIRFDCNDTHVLSSNSHNNNNPVAPLADLPRSLNHRCVLGPSDSLRHAKRCFSVSLFSRRSDISYRKPTNPQLGSIHSSVPASKYILVILFDST